MLLYFSLLASAQKINGISFVASKDSIKSHHVTSVLDVNANYVALMPFGFIRDLSFPTIRFNSKRQWFGERDQGIRQYAKELQYKRVKLMVKPQIWIWKGQFTGHITMDSEEQWRIFEDSYASFILTYAKTAEEIKADIFCIGTELENFVNKRPAYWKDLIQRSVLLKHQITLFKFRTNQFSLEQWHRCRQIIFQFDPFQEMHQ